MNDEFSLITLEVENVCPLAILFITSGSGGNRLLFKYPSSHQKSLYELFQEYKKVRRRSEDEEKYDPSNPISDIIKRFDDINTRSSLDNEVLSDSFDNIKPFSYIDNGHLSGELKDEILSNLLACRSDDFGEKLYVKLEDIVFIGHLTQQHQFSMSIHKDLPTIKHFSIVFAFKSTAKKSILQHYYVVSTAISSTICMEEKGQRFLSNEKDLIVGIYDEIQECKDNMTSDVNDLLQERCQLYQQVKEMVDQSVTEGIINHNIGKISSITYCMGTRMYHVIDNLYINNADVVNESHSLRGYHTLIMLDSVNKIVSRISIQENQQLIRFIKNISIRSNIHLATMEVPNISFHLGIRMAKALIHWGQAIPCFPLEPANRYMLTPSSLVLLSYPEITNDFHENFPNIYLPDLLQEIQTFNIVGKIFYKLGIDFRSETAEKLVTWLIKNRIIYQIHSFYNCLKLDNENSAQVAVSAAVNYTSLPLRLFRDEVSWRKFADLLTNNSIVYSADELATDIYNWEQLGQNGISLLTDILPLCNGENHMDALVFRVAVRRQLSLVPGKNYQLAACINKLMSQLNKMFTRTDAPDKTVSVHMGVK